MMIDLYCGLPWTEREIKDAIERKKLHMPDEDLMTRMPDETKFIPKHLRSLDMYQRPDYTKIHAALDLIRKKSKVSYEDSYEWESTAVATANQRTSSSWFGSRNDNDSTTSLREDPVKIERGPSANEEKEIREREKEAAKNKKPELIQID
ncbi:hypothetical protein PENTCL1PPCAC_26760, partial [Pristionchus entomophagus]